MKCSLCQKETTYKYCFMNKAKNKFMCKDCRDKKCTVDQVDDKGDKIGTIRIEMNFGQNLINREWLRKRHTKMGFIVVPDEIFDYNYNPLQEGGKL